MSRCTTMVRSKYCERPEVAKLSSMEITHAIWWEVLAEQIWWIHLYFKHHQFVMNLLGSFLPVAALRGTIICHSYIYGALRKHILVINEIAKICVMEIYVSYILQLWFCQHWATPCSHYSWRASPVYILADILWEQAPVAPGGHKRRMNTQHNTTWEYDSAGSRYWY